MTEGQKYDSNYTMTISPCQMMAPGAGVLQADGWEGVGAFHPRGVLRRLGLGLGILRMSECFDGRCGAQRSASDVCGIKVM